MLRLLNILGIIFAVVGVEAALRLFRIRSMADLHQAQHRRTVSNQVSSLLHSLGTVVEQIMPIRCNSGYGCSEYLLCAPVQ